MKLNMLLTTLAETEIDLDAVSRRKRKNQPR